MSTQKATLIHDMDPDQIGAMFAALQKDIAALKESQVKPPEELMTRAEACEFLKVDSSTLWAWNKKGKLKAFGIGSRVYYRRSDIMAMLKPL